MRSLRHLRPRLRPVLRCSAVVVAGSLLCACNPPAAGWPSAAQRAALDIPLATATVAEAPAGPGVPAPSTWAIVPVGDPGAAAGSFWEVLVQAAGRRRWSLVTPPGMADSGGVVGAFSAGGGVVGFAPSGQLGFSPVATTGDGGLRWSPGVLPSGLTPDPGSLAETPAGRLLALVGPDGSSVLESDDVASGESRLVGSRQTFARAGGRLCQPADLTAVSFAPGGQPVVAGRCESSRVGIFELTAKGWALVGPSAPPAAVGEGPSLDVSPAGLSALVPRGSAITQVLGFARSGGGLEALTEAVAEGSTSVFSLRESPSGAWASSPVFAVPPSEGLLATGEGPNGASFLLLSRSGVLTAVVLGAAASSWRRLPAPPPGTETLALTGSGATEALGVTGATLAVYGLGGRGRWERLQTLRVRLETAPPTS